MFLQSLPSRERGLKLLMVLNVSSPLCVAPLAGAWIEIAVVGMNFSDTTVAPLAGAWIEILVTPCSYDKSHTSLPSRERGLKYVNKWPIDMDFSSRSPRGSVD